MAARIKGKMERTSSWSYLCRRIGFLTAASREKKGSPKIDCYTQSCQCSDRPPDKNTKIRILIQ